MATWQIIPKFEEFRPVLFGPDEDTKHFMLAGGELFCVRDSLEKGGDPCAGCKLRNDCEFVEEKTPISLIPHSRRGIGFEEESFLILRFKPEHSFATLPVELWDNPYADKAYKHESNLHYLLTDPKTAKFWTLKEQMRYKGTREEFDASPYAEYLTVVENYEPSHHVVSLDYSAIEPRVATLASREPNWVKVFKGEPKIISKEITLTGPISELPDSVYQRDGRSYCYLQGELDKEVFSDQCAKCKAKDACTTKQSHYKNVPTDWHGINTTALYGLEFTDAPDKYIKKALRAIGKIVGLALCYGGTAWTISTAMQTSKEVAQVKIDNFFATLTVLRDYMQGLREGVRQSGKVANIFGRIRDVSKWAFSKDRSDQGYAERTALNHPIQSTGAEFLKLGMIRTDEMVVEDGLNPLYGLAHRQQLDLSMISYRSIILGILSSVHDEIPYMLRTDSFENIIPKIYQRMQLSDVMSALQAGYTLEMDCEFDDTRSWTSHEAFDTGKIYLIRLLDGLDATNGGTTGADQLTAGQPNVILLPFEGVTPDLLAALQTYRTDAPPDDSVQLLKLGTQVENTLFLHEQTFPRSFFDQRGIAYQLGVLH